MMFSIASIMNIRVGIHQSFLRTFLVLFRQLLLVLEAFEGNETFD